MAEQDDIASLCQSGEDHCGREEWQEADEAFARALELDPKSKAALLGRAISLRRNGDTETGQRILNRAIYHYPGDADLLREQGRLYLDTEEYANALKAFDQVLGTVPSDLPSLAGKLRCLREQGHLEEGLAAVAGLPDDCAQAPELRREMGRIFAARKQYDAAVEAFLDAGGEAVVIEELDATDDAPVQAFIAAIDARLGTHLPILEHIVTQNRSHDRNDEALSVVERILAIQAVNEFGLRWKIELLQELGRVSDALQAAKEALRLLGPKRVAIVRPYARLLLAEKRYEECVEALADAADEKLLLGVLQRCAAGDLERFTEALFARFPNHSRLLSKAANRMFRAGNYSQAIQFWDRLLGLNGGDKEAEEAMQGKIDCLLLMSSADGAEQALKEAFARFGRDSADFLEQKVRLYLMKGLYAEAVGVGLPQPKMEELLASHVSSLRGEKSLDRAERLLRAALAQFPNSVELLQEQGQLYIGRGQFDQAAEVWARIATLNPLDADAQCNKSFSLRASGQFSKAAEAVGQALLRTADGENRPRLLVERGLVHYSQGEYTAAIADFDAALAVGNEYVDAYLWKIKALRAQQRDDEAERTAGQALEKVPGSSVILVELAKLNFDRNDLTRAEQGYAKAIELSPESLDGYLGRAEVLLRMNRGPEAEESLLALLKARPDDVDVLSALGWHYLAKNDLARARNEFDTIVAKDPASVLGINGLGAVYFNEELYDQAEVQFRKAAQAEPFAPNLLANLAWAQVRQAEDPALKETRSVVDRKLTDAETSCTRTLQLQPNHAQAYACLGIIAFKRGKLLDSEDYLKRSLKLEPRGGSHSDLGALYAQMGRYEEARKVLEDGRELDRFDVAVCIELGNVYLQTGRIKDAVAVLREARAVAPRAEGAIRALAVALMQDGQVNEAARLLRSALRAPDTADCWQLRLTLCRLLTDLGDKSGDQDLQEEALTEASRAIKLRPDRAEPYFYAGVVAFKLRDYRRAVKHLEKCFELDPENFEAEQNLRKVKAAHWKEVALTRGGRGAGVVLGVICFALLIGIWVMYYRQKPPAAQISSAMLLTISPILLGLSFVALLLPYLSKLKLPGVEAELSQPKDQLSSGPTGTISIGTESISSGPR